LLSVALPLASLPHACQSSAELIAADGAGLALRVIAQWCLR
jgi:hypothetical protein